MERVTDDALLFAAEWLDCYDAGPDEEGENRPRLVAAMLRKMVEDRAIQAHVRALTAEVKRQKLNIPKDKILAQAKRMVAERTP